MIAIDIVVAVIACIIGNIIFNNFEKHLPFYRRILKNTILLAILSIIGVFLGRIAFWSAIGLLAIGQIILHALWFPKNGINGLTAEPHEKYLKLIGKMKGRKIL